MHALRYLVSRGPPGTSQVVQRNGTPKVVFGSVISVWPSRPTVLMLSSVKYASVSSRFCTLNAAAWWLSPTSYHSIYGVCGISVFAVRGATVDELAQQVPLVRLIA
jgi:hypothetical protein